MGFMAGVWRMLGAEDEDANAAIVEYPQTENRRPSAAVPPLSMEPQELTASPGQDIAPHTSIFVVRPQLDDQGEALFSLKEYASYLLTNQAMVMDINAIAAFDELHAMRLVDYLSGVAEAIGGSVFEVTKNIFIYAPSTVTLAGDPLTQIEVN